MKIKNSKYRWIIDAILFAGFILCFFLDLTGLAFHQLLGVFIGLFAVYHLLIHWDWVRAVAAGFIRETSSQSRTYFSLDLFIFLGFAWITGTGLVISSWLNLALSNYTTWLEIHILGSLATLALIAIKVVLHRRWIGATAHKFFVRTGLPITAAGVNPQPSAQLVSRREFLKVAIPAGVVTVAAAGLAVKSLNLLNLDSPNSDIVYAEPRASATIPAATEAVTQSTGTETAQATSTPGIASATPTPQVVPTQASSNLACTVRCNKGCSYPGRCRRYTDSNNNQRCDLGECL